MPTYKKTLFLSYFFMWRLKKKKKQKISVLENSGVHVDVVQTFSFSLFMHSLFKLFNVPGLFALILCLSVFDQFLILIKALDFGL